MEGEELDATNRHLLRLRQEDARNNTNTALSNAIGVSTSTVGARLNALESTGVIKGYKPSIDYGKAGFPLRVLFICTAPITARRRYIEAALRIPGVVDIKELMTAEENVHIEVVGQENDDITELASAIDSIGLSIREEILVKEDFSRPASVFSSDDRKR